MDYTDYSLKQRFIYTVARLKHAEAQHLKYELLAEDDEAGDREAQKLVFEERATRLQQRVAALHNELVEKGIEVPEVEHIEPLM